jgi:iron complex transport system substrate-binding protein
MSMKDIEALARQAIACGLTIHRDLGPGLLESAYEALMAQALNDIGLRVERQKPIPLLYKSVKLEEAFRADLLIEGLLLVELKSVEKLALVHSKQLLTHLRLLELPLGLLMNFGAASFKEGLQRVLNPRADMSKVEIWREENQALLAE